MTLKLNIVEIRHLQLLRSQIIAGGSDALLLREKLGWLMQVYQIVNFGLRYSRGLWRAHRCDPANFDHCDWLWNPPEHATPHGRLNEEGHPLLYASLHNRIALSEIGARQGDFVHVTHYEIGTAGLRCAVVGEFHNVHRIGQSWVDPRLRDELNKILNGIPPHEGNNLVYLDAFLADILGDIDASTNEYIRSRILAGFLFSSAPHVEAILYPSATIATGKNVAVLPEAARRLLTLKESILVEIQHVYEYGIVEFKPVGMRNHRTPTEQGNLR